MYSHLWESQCECHLWQLETGRGSADCSRHSPSSARWVSCSTNTKDKVDFLNKLWKCTPSVTTVRGLFTTGLSPGVRLPKVRWVLFGISPLLSMFWLNCGQINVVQLATWNVEGSHFAFAPHRGLGSSPEPRSRRCGTGSTGFRAEASYSRVS